MGCLRPATPGFVVTLAATVLLAVVSFCVPYFKSIFFLKATISVQGISGNITFGTLGYCLDLSNGTTCSKPSIGYQLDIDSLVGNKLPVEIPQVAVKWITYALFLHVIALIAAAGSAVFGLLAHVREMSMTCCSTCISGLAAVIAMFAFIFDLVLFFVAKARINAVGSAQIGNAIWLTLAAWLLLFFSGCFYTFGRCCISNRPRAPASDNNKWGGGKWGARDTESGPNEQLRLDAVKAEADRKARQKETEVGLPAFSETQPLTARVDGDHVYVDGDEPPPAALPPRQQSSFAGGYAKAPAGTRAVDEYYAPSNTSYPPQQNPRRQGSGYAPTSSAFSSNSITAQQQQPVGYGTSPYANYNVPTTTSPPPSNQLLGVPGRYPQDNYGREYDHTAGGSSYHTASSHDQQLSSYSQYDPYGPQSQPQNTYYTEPTSYKDPYTSSTPNPHMQTASGYVSPIAPSSPNPYLTHSSPPPQQTYQHERQYTLGGDGYGANYVPPQDYSNAHYNSTSGIPSGFYGAAQTHPTPSPIDTNVGGFIQPAQTSPVKGPRAQPPSFHINNMDQHQPEESPPDYEPGMPGITGNWGKR